MQRWDAETQVLDEVVLGQLTGLKPSEQLWLPAIKHAHHGGGVLGLMDVVEALLTPETGCPWDLKQTHQTLKKYLLEESYELLDAIDRGDDAAMLEELGDVLLQPLMHGRMAAKDGRFDLQEVAQRTADKLVRRHPHVFGNGEELEDAEAVLRQWDAIKQQEKQERGEISTRASLLDGIPSTMPALLRALGISKRAARAGFEWPDLDGVWEKLREEEAELREAITQGRAEEIESEIGDLLFTMVNLARWLQCDPEEALRKMVQRFIDRFQTMESLSPKPLDQLDPAEWEDLWTQAKIVKTSP